MFKSVTFEPQCCPGQVGGVVSIELQDDSVWKDRITEISDKSFTLGYEVIETTPEITVTSIQGEIKLFPVTDCDCTFLQWTTEYSNDVDAQVI
jgi:hypothetical protein